MHTVSESVLELSVFFVMFSLTTGRHHFFLGDSTDVVADWADQSQSDVVTVYFQRGAERLSVCVHPESSCTEDCNEHLTCVYTESHNIRTSDRWNK